MLSQHEMWAKGYNLHASREIKPTVLNGAARKHWKINVCNNRFVLLSTFRNYFRMASDSAEWLQLQKSSRSPEISLASNLLSIMFGLGVMRVIFCWLCFYIYTTIFDKVYGDLNHRVRWLPFVHQSLDAWFLLSRISEVDVESWEKIARIVNHPGFPVANLGSLGTTRKDK